MAGSKAKNSGPQFIRFFRPIIEILREQGGSGTSSEVTDKAIERLAIPEAEQAIILKSGQSRVYNQSHWARMYLVFGDLIDSSKRGVWTLTEKGEKIDLKAFNPTEFFKEIKSNQKSSDASETADSDEEVLKESISTEPLIEPIKETGLLAVLRGLSASGFERLCQRLLREHDFQEVTVTGRSGDGGIDGFGILRVNTFVSFTVFFQCKRYQGSVSAGHVRDFRGAMEGRADKGIVITTGVFTADAKKEARRDGAKPIELVDGNALVLLFQSLELGVTKQLTYSINHSFFDEYRV